MPAMSAFTTDALVMNSIPDAEYASQRIPAISIVRPRIRKLFALT